MAFPTIFGLLAAGNEPASLFDTMFNLLGTMANIQCTASGVNTIVLTPIANMPTVSSYTALQSYSFIAAGPNTGAVTVNISGVGAQNLVHPDGTSLAANDITTGQAVEICGDGVSQFFMISPLANLPTNIVPGFRNFLRNGAMGVWQRGAGGSASIAIAASNTAYTADRWYMTTLANQACTVSQQASTVTGTRFAARVQRNNAQTGVGQLLFAQPLDSDVIGALTGQTCVLSAKVSTGANWSPTSGTLSYKVFCGTGAVAKRANTPYAGETAPISGSSNIAANTAATAITTASGVIPSNTTNMELQFFWTPTGTAGANDWFQITNVQLEVATIATVFDLSQEDFVGELAKCQRFFAKSFLYSVAPVQNVGNQTNCLLTTNYNNGAAQAANATTLFPTRMRTTPSLTTYNPAVANANWRDTVNAADNVVSTLQIGDLAMSLSAAAVHAFPCTSFIHWSVDAEI